MKKLIALLAILWSFAPLGALASEFQHLYFGFAGPSHGLGIMGHAFFIFTQKPKVISGGRSYQYNVDPESLGRKSKPKMILTADEAERFIETYTQENRLITLYHLELNSQQIDQIKTNLDLDLARREKYAHYDYDVLRANCVTKMIDVINEVLPKQSQIKNNWSSRTTLGNALNLDAWTVNIPLMISVELGKSNLITPGATVTLSPAWLRSLKLNLKLSAQLKKIAPTCSWSDQKRQTIEKLLVQPQTTYLLSFQKYLSQQLKACKTKHSSEEIEVLVDLILFSLENYSELPAEQKAELGNLYTF